MASHRKAKRPNSRTKKPRGQEKASRVSASQETVINSHRADVYIDEHADEVLFVPLSRIVLDPNQPRSLVRLGKRALERRERKIIALADSIQKHGLLHPIRVRPCPPDPHGGPVADYMLIVGETRLLAYAHLGKTHIQATLSRDTDPLVIYDKQWSENEDRDALTPVQRAASIDRYRYLLAEHDGRDKPYAWEQLIGRVPVKKTEIEGYRRIMALPEAGRVLLQERDDLTLSTIVAGLRHLPTDESGILDRVQAIINAAERRQQNAQDPEWRRRQTEPARMRRHGKAGSQIPQTSQQKTEKRGTTPQTVGMLSAPENIRLEFRVPGGEQVPSFLVHVLEDDLTLGQLNDVAILQQMMKAIVAEISKRDIAKHRSRTK